MRATNLNLFSFRLLAFLLFASAPKVFAQNALSETFNPVILKPSHWSSEFDFRGSRNQNPYSNPVVGADANLFYEPRPGHTIYASAGYAQPTTNDAERNYRYGFDDIYLGYFAKSIGHYRDWLEVDSDVSVEAPTSPVSQRSTLITSFTGGFVVRYTISNRFFAVSRHNASLNFYKYETSDVAGSRYNYPWAISNAVGFGVRLWRTVTTLDYEFTHLKDYASISQNVQTLRATVTLPIDKHSALAIYARWRDRTLTNYAYLDPDTRVLGTTLSLYY